MRHPTLIAIACILLARTLTGCAATDALAEQLRYRPERTIPVESMPAIVREGFAREAGGAQPLKVDWQRTPSGTEIYEIEYVNAHGERCEVSLDRQGDRLQLPVR